MKMNPIIFYWRFAIESKDEMIQQIIEFMIMFPSHPFCEGCRKYIWFWQKGVRPTDAYHMKCFNKKYGK